jgi:hypothetical protein
MRNTRSPILLIVVLLSLFVAAPVGAAPFTRAAPTARQALPPIPEWPIIGPILKMLGVVPEQPPAEILPTPDASLPEYRISTLDDLSRLQDIEPGTRVRVVASDTDLNQIAKQVLAEKVGGDASAHVSFGTNLVAVKATGSADLAKQLGFDVPSLVRGTLNVSTTLTLSAANCRTVVNVKTLSVNGWSAGLRGLAQRTLNSQVPGMWPTDICVEQVIVTPGEIAVEGYRVP